MLTKNLSRASNFEIKSWNLAKMALIDVQKKFVFWNFEFPPILAFSAPFRSKNSNFTPFLDNRAPKSAKNAEIQNFETQTFFVHLFLYIYKVLRLFC